MGVPKYSVKKFLDRKNDYALLIPVINEGERIRKQLSDLFDLDFNIDVVIADGGSSDGSLDHDFLSKVGVNSLITKLSPGYLSTQLRAGFHFCLSEGYKGVITIDGNNKDDLRDIPIFLEKLSQGYDYIQGSRFIVGGRAVNTPILRDLGIRLIHAPLTTLGANFRITDSTNGFRGHSRKMLTDKRVSIFRDVFSSYELLAYIPMRAGKLGFKIIEVPVGRHYPSNTPTPTKISGIVSYFKLLKILVYSLFQKYNP
jgi:dolichol-phosphate mannosyltransferase